jgi:peptide-methionine (S)-S-oxide reductase
MATCPWPYGQRLTISRALHEPAKRLPRRILVIENYVSADLFGTAGFSVKQRVQTAGPQITTSAFNECQEVLRMRISTRLSSVCCLLFVATVISGCTSDAKLEVPRVTTEPAADSEAATGLSGVSAESSAEPGTQSSKKETATFAAGCFWCVEAVFEELKGVEAVRSGYTGGSEETASYYVVSEGDTGHAEVIQFDFDPTVITYEELLEVFWTTHDPTTLNRQGYDTGTQYRSAVFYHSDEQRDLATAYKKRLNDEKAFGSPVVTQIAPFDKFYSAEGDHQDYFALNRTAPYCQRIIQPKIDKVRKVFADKLR